MRPDAPVHCEASPVSILPLRGHGISPVCVFAWSKSFHRFIGMSISTHADDATRKNTNWRTRVLNAHLRAISARLQEKSPAAGHTPPEILHLALGALVGRGVRHTASSARKSGNSMETMVWFYNGGLHARTASRNAKPGSPVRSCALSRALVIISLDSHARCLDGIER